MGLWDKVKSAAKSAKCMTGFHAGEFIQIVSKPQCQLEKNCPDWGKYVTKEEHKFDAWKKDISSYHQCDLVRECIYCGTKETKKEHDWEFDGTKDSNCYPVKVCKRCGEKDKGLIPKHTFVDAGDKAVCSSCGKSITKSK